MLKISQSIGINIFLALNILISHEILIIKELNDLLTLIFGTFFDRYRQIHIPVLIGRKKKPGNIIVTEVQTIQDYDHCFIIIIYGPETGLFIHLSQPVIVNTNCSAGSRFKAVRIKDIYFIAGFSLASG